MCAVVGREHDRRRMTAISDAATQAHRSCQNRYGTHKRSMDVFFFYRPACSNIHGITHRSRDYPPTVPRGNGDESNCSPRLPARKEKHIRTRTSKRHGSHHILHTECET